MGATQKECILGATAKTAITGLRFVKYVDGGIGNASAIGDVVRGAARESQVAGRRAFYFTLDPSSTFTMEAGAACAVGDEVVSDASGKAIPLPTTAGTYFVAGQVTDDGAAAADGDDVKISPLGYKVVVS